MAMYEMGDSVVRKAVLELSETQGQTSETAWKNVVVTHFHVEVGYLQISYSTLLNDHVVVTLLPRSG